MGLVRNQNVSFFLKKYFYWEDKFTEKRRGRERELLSAGSFRKGPQWPEMS